MFTFTVEYNGQTIVWQTEKVAYHEVFGRLLINQNITTIRDIELTLIAALFKKNYQFLFLFLFFLK